MLVVIAIMGMLLAIAVPAYLGHRTKAAHAQAYAALESLRLIDEAYLAENGCYYRPAGVCTNATITGVDNIQAVFPAFRPSNVIPGDPANTLYFSYSIAFSASGGNNALQYLATATGRSGTMPEGAVFTIDQDNNRNF